MKTKMRSIFSILLCCIMVLGIFPVTAMASTSEPNQPFSFDVDKSVLQGGDVAPRQEAFTFELVYGIVS